MAVLNFKDWQLRGGEGPAAAQLDHRSRQIAVTGDIPEGSCWSWLHPALRTYGPWRRWATGWPWW